MELAAPTIAHHGYGTHGHQASLETGLDFCNTLESSRSGPEEHLPTADVALHWFMDHDLMHRDALEAESRRFAEDTAAAEHSLARIRRVRAAMRELVDATYHWHWEIHPRLREIAGLELGTGLPVNPVSPEDAVEELLARTRRTGSAVLEASG